MLNEIERNRRTFISALRNNPGNFNQIFSGDLENNWGVCALGLGCHTFGIDVYEPFHEDEETGRKYSPYTRLAEALGLETAGVSHSAVEDDIDTIWKWNDRDKLSFSRIADRCEAMWFPSEGITLEAEDITENVA